MPTTKIRAAIKLPPIGASDVVKRELLVSFDDRNQVMVNGKQVSPGTMVLGVEDDGVLVAAKEGVEVRLSLVDIDDAGNRSQPSPELVIQFKDTFAPPRPAALVIDGEEEFVEGDPTPPPPPPPGDTGPSGGGEPPPPPPPTGDSGGDSGPSGPGGGPGDDGETGPTGPDGGSGPTGESGDDGETGADGESGGPQ